MESLQGIIHRLEVGGGMRFLRIGSITLALLMLFIGYNWRAFRNMSSQEAMDSAQVARNIAQGHGYSTLFVRPLSIFLVKRHNQETQGIPEPGKTPDQAEIKQMHPDLANPPVYPLILAGLMKMLPFDYPVPTKPRPFWTNGESFWRYQPDFLISVFNELLLVAVVVLVFFLARRLFDKPVAWLSAALVLGTEMLWRFSVSGLSTMLLLVIFLAAAWSLVLLEAELREPRAPAGVFILAAITGLVIGLGALTRYSFGWLIIPVIILICLMADRQRLVLSLVAFGVFALVLTPWVVRNFAVSGTPFGTAGYAVLEMTRLFPENRLQRSLNPDLSQRDTYAFWLKLMINSRQIVTSELPKLGGTWLTAFFLVGLLIGFNDPAVRRLRQFTLFSLLTLVFVEAFGRTTLSDASPEINSENLLVLLTPIVIIYGVSLFYLLLDQIHFGFRELRYAAIGVCGFVACLPLVLTFMPPKTVPITYPPYYPPGIQRIEAWTKPEELTMSDVPWAVAWYGQRQSIWLTLNAQSDFLSVNDYLKPIAVLYLTPVTLDAKLLGESTQPGELGWGSLTIETLLRKEGPPNFPLRSLAPGWLQGRQMVLCDWPR
jgi:Dolichyl-phosphate-mannose-protein mannosyltransferase